jgi:hypothetical protein
MKKLQLFTLAVSLAATASAQSQFMIYSMKGNVTVVENKVETKAKIGNILGPSATVKIATGGSATLVCNEAAMFSIVKAGSYPLSKFNDSCKPSNSSVSSNYVKYVWAQMTKSSVDAGSNRKAYMNTVGAVTRDIRNVWIDPRLDTINYSGVTGVFPLSWKSYTDAEEFEVSLYTADNIVTPFYSTFVKKLKIPVTDLSSKIKPGNAYYWTAAIKGEESDDLKILNYVTKEIFDAVLANIKNQRPTAETPAQEAYRIAFMLEDAHYLAEAFQYYTKAAQLDSTSVLYRSTLMSFKKDYEIK